MQVRGSNLIHIRSNSRGQDYTNENGIEQLKNYTTKMRRYKEIFAKYDVNHNKSLSLNEIKKMFADSGEPVETALAWMKEFDYDKSNTLTWKEFVDLMDKREILRLIPDYIDTPQAEKKQIRKLNRAMKKQKQIEYNITINQFADQFRSLHQARLLHRMQDAKSANVATTVSPAEELVKIEQEPLTKEDLLEVLLSDKQNFKSMEEAAHAVTRLMEMIDTDHSGTISFFEFRTFLEAQLKNPEHAASLKLLSTPNGSPQGSPNSSTRSISDDQNPRKLSAEMRNEKRQSFLKAITPLIEPTISPNLSEAQKQNRRTLSLDIPNLAPIVNNEPHTSPPHDITYPSVPATQSPINVVSINSTETKKQS